MSKQVTIYLSEELEQEINADKGKLNKRILDLIHKGLIQEQSTLTVNDCIEQLYRVYKGTPITPIQKPITQEKEEETDKYKKIKTLLVKQYKEQFEDDGITTPPIPFDEIEGFIADNIEYIMEIKLTPSEKEDINNKVRTKSEVITSKAYSRLINKVNSL